MCDPCTLYYAADPLCRHCIGPARRLAIARVVGGVAAVVVSMTLGTVIMLTTVPNQMRALIPSPVPVRHVQNCAPFDHWLVEARRDLARGRPRLALHDVSLSRRDCATDPEKDRIEAFAYDQIGDKFAAIAAAVNYRDAMQARGADPDPAVERLLQVYKVRIAPADLDDALQCHPPLDL